MAKSRRSHLARNVATLLNAVFQPLAVSEGASGQSVWRQIADGVSEGFGGFQLFGDDEGLADLLLVNGVKLADISASRTSGTDVFVAARATELLDLFGRPQLLRAICKSVGLRMCVRAFAWTSTDGVFAESDIVDVLPMVKHMAPTSASATAILEQGFAMLESGQVDEVGRNAGASFLCPAMLRPVCASL